MSGAGKLARMSVMSIWPESGKDSIDERRQGDSMSKRKKITFIIIMAILLVLVLVLAGGAFVVHSYLSKLQFEMPEQAVQEGAALSDEEILKELMADEPVSDKEDSSKEEIAALEEQMAAQLAQKPAGNGAGEVGGTENAGSTSGQDGAGSQTGDSQKEMDDMLHILVIGCDSRSQGGVGRSDAMLLFSVNEETEKIHMTSIMRDSYVAIPGKGNNRLNAAYALGGGSLLLDTVETNFDVNVDKYVAFDFYSFVDIVDCLGGVEINVSEAEIPVLNGYVKELNALNGRPEGTYYVTESGLQHLNGTQALGYSRIRYVGNADFERTSRQRTVVTKAFEKVKGLSLIEINNLLNTFLPQIKTNLTQEEILSLALKALDYLQYDLDSLRLPVDDSYRHMQINGMSVLGIDLEQNRQALKEFLSQ